MKKITLRHRNPIMFLDEGRLYKANSRVWFDPADGKKFTVPARNLSAIVLGPDSLLEGSVVSTLERFGTFVIWTTKNHELPVVYGGLKPKSCRIRHQIFHQDSLETGKLFLKRRFPAANVDSIESWDGLRGLEGSCVKKAYHEQCEAYGTIWTGRWDTPPLSLAYSIANKLLYGICEVAIRVYGFEPCIGILHRNKPLSFVYDMADFFKLEYTFPWALQAVECKGAFFHAEIRRSIRQHTAQIYTQLFEILDWFLEISPPKWGSLG